jgi:ABC-type multidrug transport system fused ATPase/permease subunit
MFNLAKQILAILSKQNRYKCYALILGMAFAGILEAVGIGFVWPLIRLLGDANYLNHFTYVNQGLAVFGAINHVDKIMVLALLMLGFSLFKCFYVVWINKKSLEFTYDNQGYYGMRLLAAYLNKPYLFHVNTSSSILMRNITDGMNSVFTNVLSEYFHLLAEVLTALMIWVLLIYVDWFTAVIVAVFFGIILYFALRWIRQRAQEIGNINAEYSGEFYKWIAQSLQGIKETKIAHKEHFFVEEFNKSYKKYADSNKERYLLTNMPRSVIEVVVILGLVFLIVFKLILGATPESIVPLLGVLALAAFRLMPCVNRSVISYNSIRFGMRLFTEVYPDLLTISRSEELAYSKQRIREEILPFNKEIVIKDLAFGYDQGKLIWQHVNFTIHKGDFVGIMGASGAGKTTFADTFLGLLPPIEGQILVDGKDALADSYAWQSKLAYVAQSIFLIDGTVCENVAFGERPEQVDRDKVAQALAMAELYDFVCEMPEGIDSKIGENGVRLSGGQRQRIGIARALYQHPEILVLDEATSALDNATESAIMATLGRLKGQITMVAIAHRLSTLDNCDFKVNFEDGSAKVIR